MEGPGMQPELLKLLYNAAIDGDVASLQKLFIEDPRILERCSIAKTGQFTQSPLHVAANLGHLEFTTQILRRNPGLAEELDDLQRSSPLHMSSAKGHLEIVKALIRVSPEMCLAQDIYGRNPVHVAAIKCQIHVLDALLQAKPQAAREKTRDGETVSHLCIKHSRPEALKFLVIVMGDRELLNSKDDDGNTILHLAVATKQLEAAAFLVKETSMEINAINGNGLTAMDTYLQSKKGSSDGEICESLKRAKVLRAKDVLKSEQKPRVWVENQRNALMVVASLIATMAFQVGVSPPGGTWQDDQNPGQQDHNKRTFLPHREGGSIMAYNQVYWYETLLITNTIGMISSLSVILLLISGLPNQRLLVIILMITMWIAVTALAATYILSVAYVSYLICTQNSVTWQAVLSFSFVWLALVALLLLVHVTRLLIKLIKRLPFFTRLRISAA